MFQPLFEYPALTACPACRPERDEHAAKWLTQLIGFWGRCNPTAYVFAYSYKLGSRPWKLGLHCS